MGILGRRPVQRHVGVSIYDRRRDELFCSRDRYGIKPFNYVVHQERLMVASEIKAILAIHPELAQPNFDLLSRMLRASIGARLEETCFDQVKRLLPAHNLIATRGHPAGALLGIPGRDR